MSLTALAFDPANPDRLAPGRHRATVGDLEAVFVTAFPRSTTRATHFGHLQMLLEAVERVIAIQAVWVGGSFVTAKVDPKDVDLALHLNGDEFQAMDLPAQLLFFGAATMSRDTFKVDPFIVPVFPEGHPGRAFYEDKLAYWEDRFGTHRDDRPQGYVEMDRG